MAIHNFNLRTLFDKATKNIQIYILRKHLRLLDILKKWGEENKYVPFKKNLTPTPKSIFKFKINTSIKKEKAKQHCSHFYFNIYGRSAAKGCLLVLQICRRDGSRFPLSNRRT